MVVDCYQINVMIAAERILQGVKVHVLLLVMPSELSFSHQFDLLLVLKDDH
jgi:hypothetical protein